MTIIERDTLGTVASEILSFLAWKDIRDVADLGSLMGYHHMHGSKDTIIVERRPSDQGTTARVVSYVIPNIGIPLELRANDTLCYTMLIAKGDFELPDYESFEMDPYGNIIQSKRILSTEIHQIRAELEVLSRT